MAEKGSEREALHFRAPARLLARVKAAAVLEGMSVAEFARWALREQCARVEKDWHGRTYGPGQSGAGDE